MNSAVVAAIIAASASLLTLIGTLAAQYFGRRATSRDTEKTLKEQREQLNRTLAEQREQLDRTLKEERARTLNERFATAADKLGSDKPWPSGWPVCMPWQGWQMTGRRPGRPALTSWCAYLRLPYEPDPSDGTPAHERLSFNASRESPSHRYSGDHRTSPSRSGRVMAASALQLHRSGVRRGGLFRRAVFSGGEVRFDHAQFSGGQVRFDNAQVSGGQLRFTDAQVSGGQVSFVGTQVSGGQVRSTMPGSPADRSASTMPGSPAGRSARWHPGLRRAAPLRGVTVLRRPGQLDHAQFSGGQVRFTSASSPAARSASPAPGLRRAGPLCWHPVLWQRGPFPQRTVLRREGRLTSAQFSGARSAPPAPVLRRPGRFHRRSCLVGPA